MPVLILLSCPCRLTTLQVNRRLMQTKQNIGRKHYPVIHEN